MTVDSSQRLAAYLAAGAGFAAILSSGEIPVVIGAFAVTAFVLSYLVGERTAGRATVVWTVGIIGAFIYLAVAVVAGAVDVIVATCVFAMLISLHRLYNRRGVKDYAYVHLTSLLMIAGGSALSAELAFGVSFLVFAVGATWSLTLTHLRQEIEEEATHNRVADGGKSALADRRLVTPRLLAALGGSAIAALAVALVVFALFPRVSFGLWQRRTPGGQHTGFSDAVELGGQGIIKDDPHVAFRVRVVDGPRPGHDLGLYWRGASFDVWDGHGWQRTDPRAQPLQSRRGVWTKLGDAPAPAVDEYDVSLEPDPATNVLFAPGAPVAVKMLGAQVALQSLDPPQLFATRDGDLSWVGGRTPFVHYDVRVRRGADLQLRGLGQGYPDEIVRRFLALPPIDPRIRALALRLAKGRDPADAAVAMETFLGGFRYTLELEAHGKDPLASFLFDTRAGHCEYFATAMTVMLRAAGIPARLVSGYYGGRYVARGDYYAVREGDAHAWVEAYFPTRGWVTFDPTPPASREALISSAYASLELWLDGLRTAWRTSVVEYDLTAQLHGLKSAMELANGVGARLGAAGAELKDWPVAKMLAALVGLAVIALLGYALSRRAPSSPEAARTADQLRARALFRELARRLARHGLSLAPTTTARELARLARARELERADDVHRLVERYLATRFGDAPLPPDEASRLLREARRI